MLVTCAGCGALIIAPADPESPLVDGLHTLAILPAGWEYLPCSPPLPACSKQCVTDLIRRKPIL